MQSSISEVQVTDLRSRSWRNLFESGLIGAVWSDYEGRILDSNSEFLRIVGYSRGDLEAGRLNWRILTPPEYSPLDEHGLGECQERGFCTPYEKEYVRNDGTRIPVLVGYTRTEAPESVGPDGQFAGFVLELSGRARLVQELARSNSELSRFAHVVSHDLQAPLRLIRTHTELLRRHLGTTLSQEDSEIMETILLSAVQMQDLIESLLHHAEAGRESREPVSTSAEEAVKSVTVTLGAQLAQAGAELHIDQLPAIQSDPVELRQLFQNLLSNAVKYRSATRPLRIRISAEPCGGQIRFAVKDNGIGIHPRHHDQIFQPLKRLHGAEIPGTGMGLAVCKSIVERHGGRIWVESVPDSGSTFYFTL